MAEKYVFTLLLGIVGTLLALLLSWIVGTLQGEAAFPQALLSAPIVLGLMTLMQSIMLPLQIKFGAERSRMAMMILLALLFAAGYGIIRLLSARGVDVIATVTRMLEQSPGLMMGTLAIVALSVFLTSMGISITILEKKEL